VSFGACYDSGKHREVVLAESQVARDLRVPGTPTLFVDDQMLTGANGGMPSPEELQKAVDQAIARKGR
jgi:protein-disulfide isomerase